MIKWDKLPTETKEVFRKWGELSKKEKEALFKDIQDGKYHNAESFKLIKDERAFWQRLLERIYIFGCRFCALTGIFIGLILGWLIISDLFRKWQ